MAVRTFAVDAPRVDQTPDRCCRRITQDHAGSRRITQDHAGSRRITQMGCGGGHAGCCGGVSRMMSSARPGAFTKSVVGR
jgi:hypothetical protein